jgi:hypothetical protein
LVIRRGLRAIIAAAALWSAAGPCDLAAKPTTLVLERSIALQGVSGRIDHMAVDLRRHRLFVAELGNGSIDAIDLAAGAVIRRIQGLKEPQGLAYAPETDVLAVASAGDGSVRLFRGAELSPAGILNLGDDADNIRLDPRAGNFVVGYGNGALAVIDPGHVAVLRRVPLKAHPEGFQSDPNTGRAFVNVPDAREIAVVDLDAGRQVASWLLPDLRSNFPMALDPARAVVAVVFRHPARLALFDARKGAAIITAETCGDADDVFFDRQRSRIYVSCGEGGLDVWREDGRQLRRLEAVRTAPGARTSLFVPEWDRLFVAARAGFGGIGREAAILVLRPAD